MEGVSAIDYRKSATIVTSLPETIPMTSINLGSKGQGHGDNPDEDSGNLR